MGRLIVLVEGGFMVVLSGLFSRLYFTVLIYIFTWYSFEKELKNKLAQKSSGITSEEQVLKKSFKYFDLNGNGTVEPDEFAKAIEKIGIMIPTKQVSDFIRDWFAKFGE